MSKEKYVYGWGDPRMPLLGREAAYKYEMRPTYQIAWLPADKWKVLKTYDHMGRDEVLATNLTREAAEGFIKLLKEDG
jgi:hypothetical protein